MSADPASRPILYLGSRVSRKRSGIDSPLFKENQMKRFMIERDLPCVGDLSSDQLSDAAARSNAALRQLDGKAQWVQSFVAADKTFCVYLADDERAIHEHARTSGFPANRITEIPRIIDPTTER
jgi:hypothetical protein